MVGFGWTFGAIPCTLHNRINQLLFITLVCLIVFIFLLNLSVIVQLSCNICNPCIKNMPISWPSVLNPIFRFQRHVQSHDLDFSFIWFSGGQNMVSCSVPGCRNKLTKSGLRFFCFPSDSRRRELWKAFTTRDNLLSKYPRICEVCILLLASCNEAFFSWTIAVDKLHNFYTCNLKQFLLSRSTVLLWPVDNFILAPSKLSSVYKIQVFWLCASDKCFK